MCMHAWVSNLVQLNLPRALMSGTQCELRIWFAHIIARM